MAHKTLWAIEDISFEMLDALTDDPVVTLIVASPAGELLVAMEPVLIDGVLVCRGTHVQGGRPGAIGARNLGVIAQAFLKGMDVDELVVEGALRTTGARPGRRPRDLRFTRRLRAPPRPEP